MALGESEKKGPPRLALDSAASTRKTLARLVRLRFRGEIDSATFRDLFYGANTLLGYDKLLADLRIEERLDALETALEGNTKRPAVGKSDSRGVGNSDTPGVVIPDTKGVTTVDTPSSPIAGRQGPAEGSGDRWATFPPMMRPCPRNRSPRAIGGTSYEVQGT